MTDRQRLETVYRQAVYRVRLPEQEPLDLRVGTADHRLRRLLGSRGVRSAALLTACNPGSRQLDEAANRAAETSLLEDVRRLDAEHLPAVALDPAGVWPDEESLLVLGIGRRAAVDLARRYGQNALLWIDGDGAVKLVWAEQEPD